MSANLGTPRSQPDTASWLWTLRRNHRIAVCAVHTSDAHWDVRVSVGRETLHFDRCISPEQALALGEQWKRLLEQQGWSELAAVLEAPMQQMA